MRPAVTVVACCALPPVLLLMLHRPATRSERSSPQSSPAPLVDTADRDAAPGVAPVPSPGSRSDKAPSPGDVLRNSSDPVKLTDCARALARSGRIETALSAVRGRERLAIRAVVSGIAQASGSPRWLDVLDRLRDRTVEDPQQAAWWEQATSAAYGAWGAQFLRTEGDLYDLALAIGQRLLVRGEGGRHRRQDWLGAITSPALQPAELVWLDPGPNGQRDRAERLLADLARRAYGEKDWIAGGELCALACVVRDPEVLLRAARPLVAASYGAADDAATACGILERRGLLRPGPARKSMLGVLRSCLEHASGSTCGSVMSVALEVRAVELVEASSALVERMRKLSEASANTYLAKRDRAMLKHVSRTHAALVRLANRAERK